MGGPGRENKEEEEEAPTPTTPLAAERKERRRWRENEREIGERCAPVVGGTSHVAEFKREEESRGTSRIRDVSGARVRSLREL